ncbi:MAG TPA: hypothetical protein VGE31_00195 [Candidatus Paceibacterota bacterium]
MPNITFSPLSRNRYRCRIGTKSFIVKKGALKGFRNNGDTASLLGYLKNKKAQRPSGKKRHASKFRSKHT